MDPDVKATYSSAHFLFCLKITLTFPRCIGSLKHPNKAPFCLFLAFFFSFFILFIKLFKKIHTRRKLPGEKTLANMGQALQRAEESVASATVEPHTCRGRSARKT